MAYLKLNHLQHRFTSAGGVEDVDLSIEKGEFVSLLGPSGCGKSTTLRLMAGFLAPHAGEIRLDGEVIADANRNVAPERRNMALIFQSYAVWPHMTVYENVRYGLRIQTVPKKDAAKRVREMMEVVGIAHLADRYPHTMSGGQQQRVALARALVIRPKVLLLDEPLSNLDASLRAEMRHEIRRIHDDLGMTSVYVTHDQTEALTLSDRIAVMNAGRLEQVGTAEEVFERPSTKFVADFIGHWNCLDANCDNGGNILLPGENVIIGRTEPAASDKILVCVPIDRITLTAADSVATPVVRHAFRGKVVRVSYLGRRTEYHVRANNSGVELRVELTSETRYQLSDEVFIAIDSTACRVVPATDQVAIKRDHTANDLSVVLLAEMGAAPLDG